jgi:hypothetical protein
MATAALAGPAAHATNTAVCTAQLVVDIAPKGHISQGGISGGFTTAVGFIECAGTIAGVASLEAHGSFLDQGGGLASVSGSFSTGAGLLLHVDGPATPTSCTGDFGGNAIGLVAPLLTVSNVDCVGAGNDAAGGGNIAFVPTGAEAGPPGCVQNNGDPDVCLTQVAAAGEVHWIG